MFVSRPKVTRSAAILGVVGLFIALPASAQEHTADPYRPYNSAYDSFVYPTYPTAEGYVPNQGILQGYTGVSRANTFQDYVSDDEGDLFGRGSRRLGAGEPYFRAYRRFDQDYDRVHKQSDADTAYYEDQQARQEKYLEYLRERDPKKRAQLYREYLQDSRRVSRDLSAGRSGFSRRPSSPSTARAADAAADVESRRRSVLDTPPSITQRRGSLIDGPGASNTKPSTLGSSRRGSSSGSSSRESPSEILRRSERLNRDSRALPSPSSAPRRPGSSSRSGSTTSPSATSSSNR